MSGADAIRVRGATTHNLKGVDVDIPRGALTVITGPSGSGKSSLAFDTVFAEGQRRYVESLSPYARQFVSRLGAPEAESIEGLSPTIAIDQRSVGRNPRSTVGTATEIHDFLRVIFSRIGRPHCPECGLPISATTVDEMVDRVLAMPPGARFSVLAPIARNRKGDLQADLRRLRREGFARVILDGEVLDLSEDIAVDRRTTHDLSVYVDRLVNGPGIRKRLADSLELALGESGGIAIVSPVEGDDTTFSSTHSCTKCGAELGDLSPSAFSFNNPAGACPECGGLGETFFFDELRIVPDTTRSLREGAIAPWSRRSPQYYEGMLSAIAERHGIDPFCPWKDLPEEHREMILGGTGEEVEFAVGDGDSRKVHRRTFDGVVPNLERRRREWERRRRDGSGTDDLDLDSDELHRYASRATCEACGGTRFGRAVLCVTLGGRSIAEISALTIGGCARFFGELDLSERERAIAGRALEETRNRLSFLSRVGLDYLTLSRPTSTLSGGEAQRIRLATQMGASLIGVTYVLDEPSIGLHPRDNARFVATLEHIRDRGNTVIVVEHEIETVLAADHVVDMGPGAGSAGGEVVATGSPDEIGRDPRSLTGAYLSGRLSVATPRRRRAGRSRALDLKGVRTNNLAGIDVRIPLGVLVAVTGVSGSGKSSLVADTLAPAMKRALVGAGTGDLAMDGVEGARLVERVVHVDQSPIGRTPRSNPATFTGVLTHIRDLFAALPESRMRGYRPGRYSFNVKGGRCEACQGDGLVRIEMSFLPDAFVTCEVCGGRRYNRETLEIRYRGRSIADILDSTCDQAHDLLDGHPKIRQKLATLREVGLGYLRLGQSAATLSGGEAQRLKLARELSRRSAAGTLYLLDEPTTGLHSHDVGQLVDVLFRLVDQGGSVVVVEHDLDVIKCADWVIDLGPEGGDDGGRIVAEGTPEEVARSRSSITGRYLKKALNLEKKDR